MTRAVKHLLGGTLNYYYFNLFRLWVFYKITMTMMTTASEIKAEWDSAYGRFQHRPPILFTCLGRNIPSVGTWHLI